MGQSLNITVKQALEHTLKKGFASIITLKVQNNGGVIGESDDYQMALVMFNEFLDARVADYKWGFRDSRSTADIIVNQNDVVHRKVTKNGGTSFEIHRKPGSQTVPSESDSIDITTLKEALAEIEILKGKIKSINESYYKLQKKNNELQKENRILERENFELHERLNKKELSVMSVLTNALSGSRVETLEKEIQDLKSKMSWEQENNLQEERRKNERGEQGIFG